MRKRSVGMEKVMICRKTGSTAYPFDRSSVTTKEGTALSVEKYYVSDCSGEDLKESLLSLSRKALVLVNQPAGKLSKRFAEQLINVMRTEGVRAKYTRKMPEDQAVLKIVSTDSDHLEDERSISIVLEEYADREKDSISISSASVRAFLYDFVMKKELAAGRLSHLSEDLLRILSGWRAAVIEESEDLGVWMEFFPDGSFECGNEGMDASMHPIPYNLFRLMRQSRTEKRLIAGMEDSCGNMAVILDSGQRIITGKKKEDGIPACMAEALYPAAGIGRIQEKDRILYFPVAESIESEGETETVLYELLLPSDQALSFNDLIPLIQNARSRNGVITALPFPAEYLMKNTSRY